MKKLIILFSIISSAFCFAQDPFPFFKIKYSLLEVDSINVCNQYKIYSPSLKNYNEEKKTYSSEGHWKNFKNQYDACLDMLKGCNNCSDAYTVCSCSHMQINSSFLYIPIWQYPLVRKNDTVILNIFKMDDKSIMTIFIKTSFDLDSGELLYLKNLKFIEGQYYIDLPELIKKTKNTILNNYQIERADIPGVYHRLEKELDLSTIKDYRITQKKLKQKIQ